MRIYLDKGLVVNVTILSCSVWGVEMHLAKWRLGCFDELVRLTGGAEH